MFGSQSPKILLTASEQNLTTAAVLSILNSTRSTDIPAILKNLDEAQQDKLMAYLYKASQVALSGSAN
jgi:actin related protein 2/3 complex subunit 5